MTDKLTRTGSARHRRLIVLAGEHSWCRQSALLMLGDCDAGDESLLWISQNAPQNIRSIAAKHAVTLLGRELKTVIYDAHSGFDPDAFGAITGTVIGAGTVLLLTPALDEWTSFADPEYERILVSPYGMGEIQGRFLRRLSAHISNSEKLELIEQHKQTKSSITPRLTSITTNTAFEPAETPDQRIAIARIIKTVTGHRRRPLVLIADRGRGKSAAFGIAAAQLLTQASRRIIVTGPRLSALDAVFKHAQSLMIDQSGKNGLLIRGESRLEFVAPDELIRNSYAAELLMVDEAAGIPTPILETLLQRFSRIVFATTVHGYEGSGRGFAVRFFKLLDAYTPDWKMHRLETPIRWAPDDPVERFVFSALMLDGAPAADDVVQNAEPHQTTLEQLNRDQLVDDEVLLRELFGLLVIAHYRTRPYDLRQLLDGPNLRIYVLRHAGHIVATALIADEGLLDTAIAEAVFLGRRRLRGHLIPQSLAAHLGLPHAASLRCARIMRIAVHPALQNKGFGSRLLQQLGEQIGADGFDWIGSDFGVTSRLLHFWQRAGFVPVRVGLKREASSGAHAVLVLKTISEAAGPLLSQCREQFSRQFLHLLPEGLRAFEPALATAILADMKPPPPLTEHELREASAFASANRGYEDSIVAIKSLSLLLLTKGSGTSDTTTTSRDRELLVAKVLQQKNWSELTGPFALTGRKSILEELRRILRLALSNPSAKVAAVKSGI